MSKRTALNSVLKQANKLEDRKLARELRVSALYSMLKTADGLLQHFQGTPAEFNTREQYTAERGGKDDSSKLYGVGLPDHKKTDLSTDTFDRSLSTRYSPDRVGVQARRVSDGVSQDPVTNKIYDWNEGFKTEDGETFNGGGVSLQTDIIHRS
jgi:hypothetical protein